MTECHSVPVSRTRRASWLPVVVILLGAAASLLLALVSVVEAARVPSMLPLGQWIERAQGNTGVQLTYNLRIWGVVVLVACWLLILRGATLRRHWVAFIAWTLPQLLALTGDLFNYVEQGWVVLQGADPTVTPAASLPGPFAGWTGAWEGTTVGYPAGALLISAAIVLIAGADPALSLLLMHVPAVLGVVIAGLCLPTIARAVGVSSPALFGFVILNPVTILELCGAAHNDALALGLAVASIWAAVKLRNHPLLVQVACAGILLALAATVKPQAIAFAALLPQFGLLLGVRGNFFKRPAKDYLAGFTVAIIGIAGLAFVGPLSGVGREFLSATGSPGYRSSAPLQVMRIALETALGERFSSSFIGANFDTIALAFAVVATALVLFLARVTQPATMLTVFLIAVLIMGPAFRPWYAVWILVPLALAPIGPRIKVPTLAVVLTLALAAKNPQAVYLLNEGFALVLAAAIGAVTVYATRFEAARQLDPFEPATPASDRPAVSVRSN